jgi:hypothetical protein
MQGKTAFPYYKNNTKQPGGRMANRRRFGRRKSDYIIRYALITSLCVHVILAAWWFTGCAVDELSSIKLGTTPSSTVNAGNISGNGSPGSGKEEGDGPVLAGGGSPGGGEEEDDGPSLSGGGAPGGGGAEVTGNITIASDNDQFALIPDDSVPGKLTVSVDRDCDTYGWSLNGDPLAGSGKTIEIDTTDLAKGWYQLVFIGDIKGSPYSKSLKFEVQ